MPELMDKCALRELLPDRWRYQGYWDNLYHWQQRPAPYGNSAVLSASSEDIANGNIHELARLGYTRVAGTSGVEKIPDPNCMTCMGTGMSLRAGSLRQRCRDCGVS